MSEAPERPEGTETQWQAPRGAAGEWLPPVAPGPQPGASAGPPGWRVSPKAIDLDPNAPSGPAPWVDPGNSIADVGLGLSVAGFGVLFIGLWPFAPPLAIAGTILAALGRRRFRSGETRHGRVQSEVGLTVGAATLAICVVLLVIALAS